MRGWLSEFFTVKTCGQNIQNATHYKLNIINVITKLKPSLIFLSFPQIQRDSQDTAASSSSSSDPGNMVCVEAEVVGAALLNSPCTQRDVIG